MDKQVKAQAKYVRQSPRKTRLVVNAVRGMDVTLALAQLQYMPKAAANDVWKVVASAAANAQNNFGMQIEDLFIKEISVDEAPMYKRFRAGSKGRGLRILKRNCHINVLVASKSGVETKDEVKPAAKAKKADAQVEEAEVKVEAKPKAKKTTKSKSVNNSKK